MATRIFYGLLLMCFCSTGGICQEADDRKTIELDSKVFMVVEEQPYFEYGKNGLVDYIKKELKYPASVVKDSINGVVKVSFVIDIDGRTTDVQVVESLTPDCDEEAKRLVLAMPAWKPGRQNGKPVKVRMLLPLRFSYK